jgi:Zn-dependent protease/CBS domain-containing protein
MTGSLRIGAIKGIDIGVHSSWLLIFGLVTWLLAISYFPEQYPGWPGSLYWLAALVTSLLFFGSVLFHELAHSIVSLRFNIPVKRIELFLLGGVAQISREASRPGEEFWIAIAGPASSALLAAVFGAFALATRQISPPASAATSYLALMNISLAVFNMIPGFPMDGGRVLRALIWGAGGNFQLATRIASLFGQGIAYLFIFAGVAMILMGGFFNGLWLAFIGWFLNNAASSGYHQMHMRESLRGVTVERMMNRRFEIVPSNVTLDRLVEEYLWHDPRHAFLVVDDDRLTGIITLEDIKRIPRAAWANTVVAEAMTPAGRLQTVAPNEEVCRTLEIMHENDIGHLPVVRGSTLVGMVTRSDLLRFIQLRAELGI